MLTHAAYSLLNFLPLTFSFNRIGFSFKSENMPTIVVFSQPRPLHSREIDVLTLIDLSRENDEENGVPQ